VTNLQAGPDEIRVARDRADAFAVRATVSKRSAVEVLPEALLELSAAVEELRVCEEEIQAQADELISARSLAEADRFRHRKLFDAAPVACLVTDRAGVVREANRTAADLLNVPIDRLVGKPFVSFLVEGDRRRFHSELARLVKGYIWDAEGAFGVRPRHRQPLAVGFHVGPVPVEGAAPELFWVLHRFGADDRGGGPDTEAVERLRTLVGQLEYALGARLRIEQAKGVLMARKGVDAPAAWELLRAAARSARRRADEVAVDVIEGRLEL